MEDRQAWHELPRLGLLAHAGSSSCSQPKDTPSGEPMYTDPARHVIHHLMTFSTRPLVLDVAGGVGWITLNRPDKLNAVTPTMIAGATLALRRWADDADVRAVVILGAGERAFSAGGDVRFMQELSTEQAQLHWAEQGVLDLFIASYPKPVVALIDGIAMGSGYGFAAHASHRIVTERARIAMPETLIGLVPDVGSTALFAAAPGAVGEYLACTGESVSAADAIYAGLADLYSPANRLAEFVARLRAGEGFERCLGAAVEEPGPAPLRSARAWIDAAFTTPTASDAAAFLDAGHDEARRAAAVLRGRSPLATEVALRLVRGARELGGSPLRAALVGELRANAGLFLRDDRREGIRAQIIDRDRNPRWNPATFADVRPTEVDAALAVIPHPEALALLLAN